MIRKPPSTASGGQKISPSKPKRRSSSPDSHSSLRLYTEINQFFEVSSFVAVASVDIANAISDFSQECGYARYWCLSAPGENIASTGANRIVSDDRRREFLESHNYDIELGFAYEHAKTTGGGADLARALFKISLEAYGEKLIDGDSRGKSLISYEEIYEVFSSIFSILLQYESGTMFFGRQ